MEGEKWVLASYGYPAALGRQPGHISKGRLPLEEAEIAGHVGLV